MKDEPESVVYPQPPFPSPAEQSLVKIHKTKVHVVNERSSRKPHAPRSSVIPSSAQNDQVKVDLNQDSYQNTHESPRDLTSSKQELEVKRDIASSNDEELAVAVLHDKTTSNDLMHMDAEEQVYLYRSSPKLAERHAVALSVSA